MKTEIIDYTYQQQKKKHMFDVIMLERHDTGIFLIAEQKPVNTLR